MAGLSGYPACEANPGIAESVNVESTKKICDLMSKSQKLIYASTTYIYEISKKKINEDSPVNPKTLYARTKLEAEKICLNRENTVSLRFATIFGVSPKMRHDLILNDFVKKAVNERNIVLFDQHSLRSFIHIDDVMDAYLLTIKNFNKMKQNIYNVGSDKMNYSKLQIAKKIQKKTVCEVITSTLNDPDKRNFIIDYSKIQKFKFINKVSIDDGINELVKFYKEATVFVSTLTGTALREAGLASIPIVCYDMDWVSGTFTHKKELLFAEKNSPADLASKIEEIMDDSGLYLSVVVQMDKYAKENWSLLSIKSSLETIYLAGTRNTASKEPVC